ncbi:hypothetical protein TW81_17865 [Vibrio galatheae]|uniref:Uncharacterized protein n=1 Tax=Vibrio galatheae TaxID=579748 RepID=A0A0F4NEP5_9VIBR|nr:hypothetical protein TW81_17865 [Vibrio galatheae]
MRTLNDVSYHSDKIVSKLPCSDPKLVARAKQFVILFAAISEMSLYLDILGETRDGIRAE